MKPLKLGTAVMVLMSMLFTGPAWAQASEEGWKGESRDAWLEGRLETAYLLSPQLNNFGIDPDVHNGDLTLSGTVAKPADKSLAEEIARNLDQIGKITNNLKISDQNEGIIDKSARAFADGWRDATTTAGIATEYTANPAIKKRKIDIETDKGVVTLSGIVSSEQEKQLAEDIARSYKHVHSVTNNLTVKPGS